jgi:hypothetical protein
MVSVLVASTAHLLEPLVVIHHACAVLAQRYLSKMSQLFTEGRIRHIPTLCRTRRLRLPRHLNEKGFGVMLLHMQGLGGGTCDAAVVAASLHHGGRQTHVSRRLFKIAQLLSGGSVAGGECSAEGSGCLLCRRRPS